MTQENKYNVNKYNVELNYAMKFIINSVTILSRDNVWWYISTYIISRDSLQDVKIINIFGHNNFSSYKLSRFFFWSSFLQFLWYSTFCKQLM